MQRALPFVAAAAVTFSASVPFWNWHPDEVTYVQVALESRARGQWVDQTYLGAPSFLKPPLLGLAMRGAFALFGDGVLASRVPSLVCLFLCAWLVGAWARREAGPSAGLVASLTMLLSPLALRFGHLSMMDPPLALAFLTAAVVGREVRAGASGLSRLLALALAIGATGLLKGPALFPLVLAAFLLEAGARALRWRWALSGVTGLVLGCSWVAVMYARHGAVFTQAFFGRENLGKFSAPWSPMHVLVLAVAVVLASLPFALWPRHFFDGRVPLFARWFPVVVLAFFALPSVTFAQYLVCAQPAVALGAGVLGVRVPLRWVASYVALACTVLVGGALVTRALTSAPPFTCRQVAVEGDKSAQYQLWLAGPGLADCHVSLATCDDHTFVPRAEVTGTQLLAVLDQRSLSPLTRPVCVERRR